MLAGYKTIHICSVNDTTWRYSAEISDAIPWLVELLMAYNRGELYR
jgi:hypothetical protein